MDASILNYTVNDNVGEFLRNDKKLYIIVCILRSNKINKKPMRTETKIGFFKILSNQILDLILSKKSWSHASYGYYYSTPFDYRLILVVGVWDKNCGE